jgi:hypothetical protein
LISICALPVYHGFMVGVRATMVCLMIAVGAMAQTSQGELRFSITDSTGQALPAQIEIESDANAMHKSVHAAPDGEANVQHLPFGVYRYTVSRPGFIPASGLADIRSPLPVNVAISLNLGAVETVVEIKEAATLVDPHETGSAKTLGSREIAESQRSTPGRSLPDLLATEPGWLLEANGVLHPRGSEYQVQYVVDGLPLLDNRSPAFAPPFDFDDVESMSVLTGSYPAEFGRKLGGVIEVTTAPDTNTGLHGKAMLGGGSFGTENAYLSGQYGWNHNFLGVSADGSHTDRYLDPPVLQSFNNRATSTAASLHYERQFSDRDRLNTSYSHSEARFGVPNELQQQAAGQRQDRTSGDNELQLRYQHIINPSLLFNARAAYQDLSATLWSNTLSTPIAAAQDRGFHQGYGSLALAGQSGAHDWKAGGDFLYGSLHEAFAYNITNPDFFDPGTPLAFSFHGRAADREGSGFGQDTYRFHNLTATAGLRWDSYRLAVNKNAFSPRLGLSFYWPRVKVLFHASYDRVFQTPAIENLLLASTPAVASLSSEVLRLPVEPSHGNFYEVGITKALADHLRLNVNAFRRAVSDFADDDVLLNTGVSFPIAFSRAEIRGLEVRLDVPHWGPLSGSLSYSNQTGTGFLPITGGLFLGARATDLLAGRSSFPVTQDQRNTAGARIRYQLLKRAWAASSASYGSGLPAELDEADLQLLASEYDPRILRRVNFERNRVRPSFSLNFSAGATLWKHEARSIQLQGDLINATDRLNVIDFAGLFSGTAIGQPRCTTARIDFAF